MANFWSGFTEGFTPTYLNTRARTDRKEELDRARQQLLSDRDIVRQQRLSDMAMDRQQRVDDRDAERAYQARLTAAARKYAEDRERRKIIAAIQSTDPSVSEQARDEAFFAQPREEQEAAAYRGEAREGFKEVSPLGVESSVRPEPSQMRGDVGYRDLGDEGLWGANARAARLQKGADAAKKIRADLAVLGNQYGLVQGADEGNAPFAARIEVAKNEAAVNLARETAAATTGGTNRGKIGPRSDAALGYMATVGLDSNIREHFAERDENGKIRTDENGEIVDRIDQDTGMPEWRAYLASDAVFNELDELSKKYEEYIGVFGRKPKMLDGTPENMDDIREGRGGRNDLDDRGAAISRLQAEIDREKAEQEDDRKVALKQEMDALPKPVLAQLDKLRKAYHAEGADQQAILGNAALLLGSETGVFVAKEQAAAFLESGELAAGGVDIKPITESATQKQMRITLQDSIVKLDSLIDSSKNENWTGAVPTAKSKILDEFLQVVPGMRKHVNWERLEFRKKAGIVAFNIIKAINEESRMSDMDLKFLAPLVPTETDEYPEFQSKLKTIREMAWNKLQLQDAAAGREDVFSLEPVDFFSKLGKPSEKFGGAIVIPKGMAEPTIRTMPQYRFIGGDKTKPVTVPYIMGQEGLTDAQKFMWIKNANIGR
jgi:hypothetical protein